jgi:ubiquitin carboxyl-terminal hydrolase 7
LNQSIAEIMAPSYLHPTGVILYEKLDVSIVELETKRSLKVIWTGIHNKEEAVHSFLLPKTSMIHDLADNLAKLVILAPGGTGKIRIFEVSKDGKTQKEFTGSEMIGNIPDPVELYAEVCQCERLERPSPLSVIYRKFPGRSSRRMTRIRLSVYFTSRKNFRERMVCRLNLWSNV